MRFEPLSRRRLVVLAYHDIQDVNTFRSHVDFIRAKLQPVGVDQVIEAQHGGRPLPPRAVLVTFDDGDRTVYEHALPILFEHDVPAVVFPVTSLIGSQRPFWFHEARELVRRGVDPGGSVSSSPDDFVRYLKQIRDEERRRLLDELRSASNEVISQNQLEPHELREMERKGIEIGSHTHTHPCLDQCGENVILGEVTKAHEELTEWLSRSPRVFAYPNGNGDVRAETVLNRLGYDLAFLFDHRIQSLPVANPLRISRVRVNSTTTMMRFRSIIAGLHPFVHHAVGRS
ncbi:hypothetical protein BH23GEM6_BH23GEM6_18070 [soil metagenome]